MSGVDFPGFLVETGHLLYADVSGTLWAVAFDPRAGEVMGEPATLFNGITKTAPSYARFSVSNTGTLVYGTGLGVGGGGDGRLTTVWLDGTVEVENLAPRLFDRPQWSPNGRFVAYSGLEPGETDLDAQQIYTYDMVAKSQPRRLTGEGNNTWPVWSPDRSRVAFGSEREDTDGFDLFMKTVDDDAPPRLLISLPGRQAPNDWPADDVLLFRNGTGRDLWIADLSEWATSDSVAAEPYIESSGGQEPASLAPQGDLVVYSTTVGSNWEVFVRSFPESRLPEKVSEGGGDYPVWSADGNTIYYLNSAGEDTLYAARIDRGPPFVVIESAPVMPWDFDIRFDLHPDGDRFIAVQPTGTGAGGDSERFVIVTNFFEELRQRMGN